MRVEFLGTGGYRPNERRHTMCVMLPEAGIVLDAGTGAFRIPHRLQTAELQIFLSHAHLDHVCGLTYLLPTLLSGRVSRARVYGTAATLDGVRSHLFADPIFPIMPAFEWVPLEGEVVVPDGGVATAQPLQHPGGSTGYRIAWPGGSLAYITDTTVDGTYTEFVRGVDLLIHECFVAESAEWAREIGHSHALPVFELAREAGVGRLVLVHIDPDRADDDPVGLDAGRAIFPQAQVAEDLMCLDL